MGKYILLGMNQPNSSRNNYRIIHEAEDYEQLVRTWETIEKFYSLIETDGNNIQNAAAKQMIKEHPYLSSLYEVYYESIIFTVTIVGIFEALKVSATNYSSSLSG